MNILTVICKNIPYSIDTAPSVVVASDPESSVVPKRMQLLVSSSCRVVSAYVRLVCAGKPDEARMAAVKVTLVPLRKAIVVLGVNKTTDGTTCN